MERAQAMLRRNQLDSALATIQAAVDAEPDRAEAHYWLGEIAGSKAGAAGGLGAMGFARRSRAGFARAVELAPDSVRYLAGLAGYLAQAPGIAGGNRDSALVLAERVRRVDESRGTFLVVSVLRRGNELDRARGDSIIEAFGRSRPTDRVAQLSVAGHWSQTDRPERALAVFESVLARDTTDVVARFGVARSLVVLRRDPARAQASLRHVLARPVPPAGEPTFTAAAAWWRLGQTFVQLGLPDSARAAYEQSLRLSPQFRQARASLDSLRGR